MTHILIIDDEESICWGLSNLCKQMSYEASTASTAEKGLELASSNEFDVVVMDVRLPGIDGVAAIEQFHQRLGRIPIIIITAFSDLKTTIEAFQSGAFEFITKPFELDSVRSTIAQAVAASRIIKSSTQSVSQVEDQQSKHFAGFIGNSRIMQEVFKQIALTTTTDAPVMITGESGTGKELTARAIHNYGARADKPFVPVNIAALNPLLVESELFGHIKGAFTGADSSREGLIQKAHGGTLFLDEIAEIPMEIQVKLLRVLDSGEVSPVGSNKVVKTDFRLITATHQDLLSQINFGDFRHDLFHRLRSLEIHLPPLRHRTEDIPVLVQYFVSNANVQQRVTISDSFVTALQSRKWPGNIRELKNVVLRAVTIARGGVLTTEHVDVTEPQSTQTLELADANQTLQRLIKDWTKRNWHDASGKGLYEKLLDIIEPPILSAAFELSNQQYSAAARRLGIHRTTLKRKLDDVRPEMDNGF
jgi:two-component system, NtrC family, nitrogen regulation response regulator GlnG